MTKLVGQLMDAGSDIGSLNFLWGHYARFYIMIQPAGIEIWCRLLDLPENYYGIRRKRSVVSWDDVVTSNGRAVSDAIGRLRTLFAFSQPPLPDDLARLPVNYTDKPVGPMAFGSDIGVALEQEHD